MQRHSENRSMRIENLNSLVDKATNALTGRPIRGLVCTKGSFRF